MSPELADNLFQWLAYMICTVVSLRSWSRRYYRGWFMLSGYFVCNLLGLTYWTSYLAIYHDTPRIFYVADISWTACFIFLLIVVTNTLTEEEGSFRTPWSFVIAAAALGVTIYYSLGGTILFNILDDFPLGAAGWYAARGLAYQHRRGSDGTGAADDGTRARFFCAVIAVIMLYFSLWVLSGFGSRESWADPYFWTDVAVTAANCYLLYAYSRLRGREEEREAQV